VVSTQVQQGTTGIFFFFFFFLFFVRGKIENQSLST
jgi:hypothetical protein